MSEFHTSASWVALAKKHKAIERAHGRWKCKDCGYTGKAMESDHELSVKHWPMSKLWLCNLTLRCGPEAKGCNQKKGAKFYYSPKSIKLRGYYYSMKALHILAALIILAIVVDFLYIDYNRGSFDTTIMFQVWGDIVNLWAWIRQP